MSKSYDAFKKHYDTEDKARSYEADRFTRTARMRRVDATERNAVRSFLEAAGRGAAILDCPCGNGRFVQIARETGVLYRGCDISEPMLEHLRAIYPEVDVRSADARSLPFDDDSFDGTLSIRLFHRLKDADIRMDILRELRRVTRGPILTTWYSKWNMRGLRRIVQGKYPGVACREIERDAAAVGLAVSRTWPLARFTQQQRFFEFVRA